jgi:acyl-coenzyme A synthetase/AMP-(fatty) acid ligase
MSASLATTLAPRERHLGGLVDAAGEAFGDAPLFVGERAMSFREAGSATRRVAASLATCGVGRGDRVVIVAENAPDVALLALAAARLGAVFAILHHETRPHGLRAVVEQVAPKIVALDARTWALADAARPAKIVALSGRATGATALEEWASRPDPGNAAFPGVDANVACLLFTSGSSGRARGVMASHDNLLFSTAAIQDRLGYRPDDTIGVFLPMSFDYGLYQVLLALATGASVALRTPESAGPTLLSLAAKDGSSVLPLMPGLVASALRLLRRKATPLPRLRLVTSTGDYLPPSDAEALERSLPGVRVAPMYGLTECKRVSILLPEERSARPRSVGRPLAGTEAFVVGQGGARLSPGETGELVVRGRHVTLGYYGAPDETAARFRRVHGEARTELWTGDLCRMDDDGYLWHAGRVDSLFKHRGFRLSPIEIEGEACQCAGVVEAGLARGASDGKLRLFVRVDGDTFDASGLLDTLRERLEPHKVPDEVIVATELPRTPNGKIDRARLAEEGVAT